MKLMKLTLMTPIRDEKQIIYKWEEREILLNPKNIETVGYVKEIDKLQVLFTSGRCCPVKESQKEIELRYDRATSP